MPSVMVASAPTKEPSTGRGGIFIKSSKLPWMASAILLVRVMLSSKPMALLNSIDLASR
ncbi:hypothetical protein D3C81_2324450 [compost metagenome]